MFGMGKNTGNRYSEEFKEGAIKLVRENKQSVAEVCRNLGVSRNAMDRWLAADADSNETRRFGYVNWRPKTSNSAKIRRI